MNRFALTFISSIALLLGSCRESNQDAGPDLTTSLTGQFSPTYLIVDPAKGQIGSTGATAQVQLERKNNNTLTIAVKINDATVQINDHYNATLTPSSLEEDGLLIPGLRSRYKLTATHLNNKGSSVSFLNLYSDGKVRGGLVYVNTVGQSISLAFLP